MSDKTQYDLALIETMPKASLHNHAVAGICDLTTLMDIMRSHPERFAIEETSLPNTNLTEYTVSFLSENGVDKKVTFMGSEEQNSYRYDDFAAFLSLFDVVNSTVKTEQELNATLTSYVDSLSANGTNTALLEINLQTVSQNVFGDTPDRFEKMTNLLHDTMLYAESKGIALGFEAAFQRSFGPAAAEETLSAVEACFATEHGHKVIQSIACGGNPFDPNGYATHFSDSYLKAFKSLGLGISIHGGEVDDNIPQTLELLAPIAAGRDAHDPSIAIDHGFRLTGNYQALEAARLGDAKSNTFAQLRQSYLDQEASNIQTIKEDGIFLRMTPIMNVELGEEWWDPRANEGIGGKVMIESLASHPISYLFHEKGLKYQITVGGDNPAMGGGYSQDIYTRLHNEAGFSVEDLLVLTLNGIRASNFSHDIKSAQVGNCLAWAHENNVRMDREHPVFNELGVDASAVAIAKPPANEAITTPAKAGIPPDLSAVLIAQQLQSDAARQNQM